VAATLSDSLKQLLDGPVFVTLATIQPDGSPQVSPVWVERDGEHLQISTTVDRRKYLNMTRDPRVTVVAVDSQMPYNYAEIRGTVDLVSEGAADLIDRLARKYTGKSSYAEFNPAAVNDAERVIVRVTPRKILGMGNLT
jgi:PPOX class probable F420-dependent enzyme